MSKCFVFREHSFADDKLDNMSDRYIQISNFMVHVAASYRKHISEKTH